MMAVFTLTRRASERASARAVFTLTRRASEGGSTDTPGGCFVSEEYDPRLRVGLVCFPRSRRGFRANRQKIPLQSTRTFDESKTNCAVIVNPMAKVAKIKQNVLEAAESARKSPGEKVFDGKR